MGANTIGRSADDVTPDSPVIESPYRDGMKLLPALASALVAITLGIFGPPASAANSINGDIDGDGLEDSLEDALATPRHCHPRSRRSWI